MPVKTLKISPLVLLVLTASTLSADTLSTVISRTCPYSCASINLSGAECRDWRIGDTCYVEDLRSGTARDRSRYKMCVRTSSGVIRIRKRCHEDKNETAVALEDMRGETGLQGATGPQGSQGPQGNDGALRIYGDGSAGGRSVESSTTLNDSNPQYTDFSVGLGVTLTVPSGTVIRCTGTFTNSGTITVQSPLRDHPRFGENGFRPVNAASGGSESEGGSGGAALAAGVAKGLLRLGLLAGGSGYRDQSELSGSGGGNFSVLCQGAVTNAGTITANGANASSQYRGGGGGGFIVLASAQSVSNVGTIRASGGNGGTFLATDANNTGHGPGGGGGGGIVHLIAPLVASTGTIEVAPGSGGSAAGSGSITGILYVGGDGGGGAGGDGGSGGTVNPGNSNDGSTTAGASGSTGRIIETLADPAALY